MSARRGALGLERAFGPLDRAREGLLRRLSRSPRLFSWIRERDARVTLRALVAVGFALLLACFAPALALAIGPLVFGVPHVAASVRYLVLRRSLDKPLLAGLLGLSLTLIALRVWALGAHEPSLPIRLEMALGALSALLAVVFGHLRARATGATPHPLVGLLVPVSIAQAVLLVYAPFLGRALFVHLHNLGPVVIWALLFRRRMSGRTAVVLASLVLAIAFVLGVLPFAPELPAFEWGSSALGVSLDRVAAWLSPGAPPALARRLALAHVLTDGIHYAFWLGVIPDQAARGQGTLGFRQTYRGLARDFGGALPWVVLAALLVPVLALVGVPDVRSVYFSLAGFHGYLEGALLVHALVSGEKSLAEPASTQARRERGEAFVRTRFPSSAGLS